MVPAAATVAIAAPSGSGVLQVFTAAKGRAAWLAGVAKLMQQERGQPVQIDAQVFGGWGDVTDKLQAITAGGAAPPDLAAVEISQFPRWIRSGQRPPFAPLDAALGDRKRDLFLPSATDPWTWEGHVYGVGNELNAALLSVRADLFQRAGVDPATIRHWPDILDVGRRIKTVAGGGLT